MIQTNDVLTAISTLQLALQKMSPDTRAAASKSTLQQVKSLANMSLNTLSKYNISDLLRSELLALSQLVETIVNSVGFIETDANGKSLIVKSLNNAINLASLFACNFYSENEFNFYSGLQPVLTSIVKVGVAHNFEFN